MTTLRRVLGGLALVAGLIVLTLHLSRCERSETSVGPPPRTGTTTATQAGRGLPAFVLPAPRPSARLVLELADPPGDQTSLLDVARSLDRRLARAGYRDAAYFSATNGFALATRMERIRRDGSPYPGDARWNADATGLLSLAGPVTLRSLAAALRNADPGAYRVIVFVVTDAPVTANGTSLASERARRLVADGAGALPRSFDDVPYGPDHMVTALIYEFRRTAVGRPAEFSSPSAVPARLQLERSGLLEGG